LTATLKHKLTAFALAAGCLLHAGQASAGAGGPPLRGGVSLHGPMTWGRTDYDRLAYFWPVYDLPRYDVPTGLLSQVKAAGFDSIRLTVDPGPLLALTGGQRDGLDRRLAEVVGQIRQAGLDVIVDFHPIGMLKAYGPGRIESNADGLFDAYVAMIARTARLFAAQAGHVAIEPMNEPQMGYNPAEIARWQGMMERLYRAVRSESPELTVIVSGGRGGSFEGLLALDPKPFAGDGHVRYSIHYYLPYVFTMQGVANSNKKARIWQFVDGLPYPANPADYDRFMTLVKQRVEAAGNLKPEEKAEILADGGTQVADYFNGKGSHAAIVADFDRVAAWAKGNHVGLDQILVGEFGVTQKGPSTKGAEPEDRARWLEDVRSTAEARGFRWSLWNLNDKNSSGMTLVSVTDPFQVDVLTVRALRKGSSAAGR
jgi:endoglucanase